GNDGNGSGLDADMIDGIQSERLIYGDNGTGTFGINGQNLNDLVKSGFYEILNGVNVPNVPTASGWFWVLNLGHTGNINGTVKYGLQIAGANVNNELCFRNRDANGTGTWCRIWNDKNDGYGSGLDADMLEGYHGNIECQPNNVVIRDAQGDINVNTANTKKVTIDNKISIDYNSTTNAIEFVVI
ncbi:hypothetical protein V6O07_05425, partial [Arthrospira platensis SPKY2]